MAYEPLSLEGFLQEIKEVTHSSHPRKFCFVLGAGASRSSGIPSGQELVRIWDRELRTRNPQAHGHWRDGLGITDENMSSFYSQYYEKRFARMPSDGYSYLEKQMDSAKPSVGYVILAYLLTHTPHNVVVTTNFDHLTEDAVQYYAQRMPMVVGHESLAGHVTAQPVRPAILKIHRDLLFDPRSRTEDLATLPDRWKGALEKIFLNYHPVFIGYAGNDRSVMDFLLENSEKFAENVWKCPYWMLYTRDQLEGRVKEFLEKGRGYCIRHDGFDQVMIRLGDAFAYKLPDKQTFLADAEKRYQALADAFDAFADASKRRDKGEEGQSGREAGRDKPEGVQAGIGQALANITGQAEAQRMYQAANDCISQGDSAGAVEWLRQLIRQDPENPRYYDRLGDALEALGKDEEARLAYGKAVELDPDETLYHADLAMQLQKMNRFSEALAEVNAAIALDPQDGGLHCLAGDLLAKLEQNQEALAAYTKAVELDPALDVAHAKMAMLLLAMDRDQEALEAIQKAIHAGGEEPSYYTFLSVVLCRLGRDREAEAAGKKATALRQKKGEPGGKMP